MFIFSIPIQQAENLQRIRSNRGSRLSPTISFVANNSPAKAGLVKGGSLGISIRGRRKPGKGTGNPKTEQITEKKQSINAKNIYTQRRGERKRGVTDQPCHCLRPCKKKRKPVKNNPEHKEEERKAEEQPLSPFLQKKNNPEIKSSRR